MEKTGLEEEPKYFSRCISKLIPNYFITSTRPHSLIDHVPKALMTMYLRP